MMLFCSKWLLVVSTGYALLVIGEENIGEEKETSYH